MLAWLSDPDHASELADSEGDFVSSCADPRRALGHVTSKPVAAIPGG